jgi:hypothetical protein
MEVHAIPECGHLPHDEKPEEINRLLINFLADWKGRLRSVTAGGRPRRSGCNAVLNETQEIGHDVSAFRYSR